jgi:hypothetical protein
VGSGRPALIPNGEQATGAWDWGQIYTANSPPVLSDDGRTLRFWYGGANSLHDKLVDMRASIGIAELRVDGFASWTTNAATTDGEASFTTVLQPPITNPSHRLRVNFQGRVSVSLLVGGVVKEQQELSGDDVGLEIGWSLPLTQQYALEFTLAQGSHVYSFAAF